MAKRRDRRSRSRSGLVEHWQQDIEQKYEVGDKAGEGSQGVVFRATRKRTGVMRAIKKVPKWKVNAAAFRKEIDIMKRMDHPNIIKLYETFDDRACTYLVMELCNGGELFDKIVGEGSLSETSAAVVMQQILRAVQYMHEQDIAHRDLKPENFIFCNNGPIDEDNLLKLIDFGVACECGPNGVMREVVGTPFYMAPQVVAKKYDKSCDVWSCGVIMFALLSGNVPFSGPSDQTVLAKVREGIARFSGPEWDRVSSGGRQLVRRMLTRNPKDRISALEALEHEWIQHLAPGTDTPISGDVVHRLGAFRRKNLLKQMALRIVASEANESKIRALRDTFTALDVDGDGILSYSEVRCAMERAGLEVTGDMLELCKGAKDRDDTIDWTEFVASTLDMRKHVSDQAIAVAFAMFDCDDTGCLSTRDVARVFAKSCSRSARLTDVENIVRKYSRSGSDVLDFDDFRTMMCDDNSPMERLCTAA